MSKATPAECSVDDCIKLRKQGCRVCPMHAERLRVHGSYDKPERKAKVYPECIKDGCNSPGSRAKGMCLRHYQRQWHEAHRDETYAKAKARHAEDREGYLAVHRAYYAANRTRMLAQMAARYAADPESRRADARAWAKANPEKKRDAARAYYAANRDTIRDAHHAYYLANREKLLAVNTAYRAANPEKYRAAAKAWREANPLLRNEAEMRRRALKRETQVEPVSYAAILADFGMTCHICMDPIESKAHLHFDHVIPLSRGGSHTPGNILPAHAICNMRKHARLLEEVMPGCQKLRSVV